jgi:hypothetical protein
MKELGGFLNTWVVKDSSQALMLFAELSVTPLFHAALLADSVVAPPTELTTIADDHPGLTFPTSSTSSESESLLLCHLQATSLHEDGKQIELHQGPAESDGAAFISKFQRGKQTGFRSCFPVLFDKQCYLARNFRFVRHPSASPLGYGERKTQAF